MKFSVVIPLYNKVHTIVRTINSVLSQVYTDFELIIIDDGSTDGSKDVILKKFNDKRISLYTQKNSGVSASRNRGVNLAKGEYIAFLDADDEWMPYYLQTVSDEIVKFPNAGLIHIPAFHRDIVTGYGLIAVVKRYRRKCLLVDLFSSAYNICAQTSGIIVKRDTFEYFKKNVLNGFPEDMTYEEDMSCFFSYALFTPSLYVGYPLSIRNTNVSGQLVRRKKPEVLIPCQAKYLNHLYNSYLIRKQKNKTFEVFFKYELRTRISSSLKENQYINFINKLSTDVKRSLSPIEWLIYDKRIPLFLKCQILNFLRLRYYLNKYKYNIK